MSGFRRADAEVAVLRQPSVTSQYNLTYRTLQFVHYIM